MQLFMFAARKYAHLKCWHKWINQQKPQGLLAYMIFSIFISRAILHSHFDPYTYDAGQGGVNRKKHGNFTRQSFCQQNVLWVILVSLLIYCYVFIMISKIRQDELLSRLCCNATSQIGTLDNTEWSSLFVTYSTAPHTSVSRYILIITEKLLDYMQCLSTSSAQKNLTCL